MGRIWAEAGHKVTVLAGTINHFTGKNAPRFRRRWLTRERDGDIDVWRCFIPESYASGYTGRKIGYLSYTLSALTAALLTSRADVVIATSPPLTTVIAGWLKARLSGRKTPWVFEIRDLWPESAVTTGVVRADAPLTRLLGQLEAWACRKASRVVVLTPAFRDDLVGRGLVSVERVFYAPNAADLDGWNPGPKDNHIRTGKGWGDRFVVTYAGAHGRANRLDQVLDAALLLRHRDDILIALVGDGPERTRLQTEAQNRSLSNVRFYGPQPKASMPDWIRASDAGLAVLQRNPTFRTVYPNKIFDYMACARPVVLAIDGVARQLVCDDAKAGVFAEPEDAHGIASAIESLADDREHSQSLGRNGRTWVEAHASRRVIANQYLNLLEELVAARDDQRLRHTTKSL